MTPEIAVEPLNEVVFLSGGHLTGPGELSHLKCGSSKKSKKWRFKRDLLDFKSESKSADRELPRFENPKDLAFLNLRNGLQYSLFIFRLARIGGKL